MVFIIESIILCGLFTLAVRFKLMSNPIKAIMSYPPAIRKRVESLPQYQGTIRQEKRTHIGKKLLAVPIMAVLMAAASWLGGARDFLSALLYIFGLYTVVNLWDMIVLDWLWFCRSHKVRLPGTEDMDKEYRDHLFHLRGFFKGCAIGAVISAISAGLIVAANTLFM